MAEPIRIMRSGPLPYNTGKRSQVFDSFDFLNIADDLPILTGWWDASHRTDDPAAGILMELDNRISGGPALRQLDLATEGYAAPFSTPEIPTTSAGGILMYRDALEFTATKNVAGGPIQRLTSALRIVPQTGAFTILAAFRPTANAVDVFGSKDSPANLRMTFADGGATLRFVVVSQTMSLPHPTGTWNGSDMAARAGRDAAGNLFLEAIGTDMADWIASATVAATTSNISATTCIGDCDHDTAGAFHFKGLLRALGVLTGAPTPDQNTTAKNLIRSQGPGF